MRPTPVLYCATLLVLVVLVLWGFGRVLAFDFLTPETWHGIQDLSGKHVLVVQSGGGGRLGQPLPLVATHLTLVLDRMFWGSTALGYHLTNLLLHLTGVLLVLLVIYELAGDWLLAASVAALYAVHPLQLQLVAPVTSRSELLHGCLWSGAFLAYLLSRREGRTGRWVVLCAALYLLAVLEKPAAIGLGLLILAHGRLFLGPHRRAPRLAWALLGMGLALLVAFHLTGRLQVPWLRYKGGPLAVLLSGPANLGRYLQVVFWPRHSTFGLDIAVPPVWAGLAGLGGYALLLVLLGLLVRRSGTAGKLCLFGAVWFGLTLLSEVNLFHANLNLFAAAHLALALLGAILLVLVPLRWLAGEQPQGSMALGVIVVGLVVGLAATSFSRSALWRDASTLWESVRRRDPQNYWASYHLSLYHAWQNREEFDPVKVKQNLERSLEAIEQAIGSASRGRHVFGERNYLHQAKLRNDLAGAEIGLASLGLVEERQVVRQVERWLEQGLASCALAEKVFRRNQQRGLYSDRDEQRLTESNLETMKGSLLERQATYRGGRPDPAALEQAERHFRRALELHSTAMTLTNLAKVLLDRGQRQEAESLLEQALARHPAAESAYTMRGTLASNDKQPARALHYFRLALDRARYPAERIDILCRLARVYTNLRQLESAEAQWAGVLKLDPGNYTANWELAGIYINEKRWREAIRRLNTLIASHPRAPRPRSTLSEIYRKWGDSLFEKLGRHIIGSRKPPREGPVGDVELLNNAAARPEVLARLRDVAKRYHDALAALPTDPAARQRFAMIFYYEAVGMLMAGNLKDGITQLARVVRRFPEYAPARAMVLATVQLLVQHGKWKKIHEVLTAAHAENPDNPLLQGLKLQMDLYAEQERQHPRIVREAELFLRRQPNAFRANWIVGNHLARQGKEAEANRHYSIALLHVEGGEQIRTNFEKEYIGWLIRWAKRARQRLVRGTDPAKNRALFSGHLEQAARLIKPHYERDPGGAEVANNLALIYQLAGQLGKAIVVLRGIQGPQPHHKLLLAELLYKRALQSRRGDAERTRDLREAIAVLGPAAPAKYRQQMVALQGEELLRAGMAAYQAGKLKQALELIGRSGRRDYRAQLHLGLIHAGLKQPRRAFSHLELANAADGRKPDALFELARVYEQLGGPKLALAYNRYTRCLSLLRRIDGDPLRYPASGEQLARWNAWVPVIERRLAALEGQFREAMRRGLELYQARKHGPAGEQFQRAVWIRPRDVDARYYHAVCLAEQREIDRAVKGLEAVLRLDPRHALAHYRLGVLYYGYGPERYGKALEHLDRSIALGLDPQIAELARRYAGVMRKKQ